MRELTVLALVLCIALFPAVGQADEDASPNVAAPRAALLDLDLSGRDLVIAATIGAGVGALVAAVGGNTLLAASAGTIAGIYVAHLVVEAVIIGGMLYLWPDQEEQEEIGRIDRAGSAAGLYERPLIRGQVEFAALTGGDRVADASLRMIDLAAAPGD